jgi:hypothetical protein
LVDFHSRQRFGAKPNPSGQIASSRMYRAIIPNNGIQTILHPQNNDII